MTTAQAKFMTVTPKIAERWLEEHEDVVRESGLTSLNRIINDNVVTQYGTDMKSGRWIENGESVKRAKNGRLVDGQHRLWACVQSGSPFRTLVVEGFSEAETQDVFQTTDIGRVKIPSAFLSASGVQYSGFVAPAIRYIIAAKQHGTLTKVHMITTPEVVDFGRDNSERLVDSAAFIAKYQGYAPGSILTAWHYLMFEKNQEQAAKFIIDLKDGIGLQKGDPVHALRERLIQNKGSKTKLVAKSTFVLGLHMWNDRRKNVSRTVIKAPQLDYKTVPKIV